MAAVVLAALTGVSAALFGQRVRFLLALIRAGAPDYSDANSSNSARAAAIPKGTYSTSMRSFGE